MAERGFTGGEFTVRTKVRELKEALPKAFVPLVFSPGEAIQVDWGEAVVYINGAKQTANLFGSRLCHSCILVVIAYRRQNEESFLDAFTQTFRRLGGVPEKVIFDNGKVAVKDGFGAHARKQAGYTALSAHYGFDALFCNPAEGHEKGLVVGLVGWARRNILVPIPRGSDHSELNSLLAEHCRAYGDHHIQGKSAPFGMPTAGTFGRDGHCQRRRLLQKSHHATQEGAVAHYRRMDAISICTAVSAHRREDTAASRTARSPRPPPTPTAP